MYTDTDTDDVPTHDISWWGFFDRWPCSITNGISRHSWCHEFVMANMHANYWNVTEMLRLSYLDIYKFPSCWDIRKATWLVISLIHRMFVPGKKAHISRGSVSPLDASNAILGRMPGLGKGGERVSSPSTSAHECGHPVEVACELLKVGKI
jgi:hypothetical protein